MKVAAPFEVAICVRSFERVVAFYRDALGMSVFSLDTVTPEESDKAGLSARGYRIARLETSMGDRLKVVGPNEVPPPQAPEEHVLGRHGFAYLTFVVPDLAEIVAKLEAAQARFRTSSRVAFRPGVDLVFAEDPEGNFLEFVQRNDLATYRPGLPA